MSRELELSKHFILSILNSYAEPTPEGLYDIMQIKSGDNELLLSHLKSVTNIMNIAIAELEKGEKDA